MGLIVLGIAWVGLKAGARQKHSLKGEIVKTDENPLETENWFLSLTVTHKAKQNRTEVIV